MFILLYYWANKIMMMTMMNFVTRRELGRLVQVRSVQFTLSAVNNPLTFLCLHVRWANRWVLQNRLNRSRCWLVRAKGTTHSTAVYIDASWRIRLDDPCTAAMRPCVKSFFATCLYNSYRNSVHETVSGSVVRNRAENETRFSKLIIS